MVRCIFVVASFTEFPPRYITEISCQAKQALMGNGLMMQKHHDSTTYC